MNPMASNSAFIIAAYGVTWVALLGTVVRLALRGARARKELEHALAHGTGMERL